MGDLKCAELGAEGISDQLDLLDRLLDEDSAPEVEVADDAGDDVAAWWVTAKSRETYAEVKRRWAALLAWKVGDRLPHRRNALEFWRQFEARWEAGDEDVDKLPTVTNELNDVETEAREKGYQQAGPKLQAQSVDELTALYRAGAWADREVFQELEKAGVPLPTANAPKEIQAAVKQAGASAADTWRNTPLGLKAAGGLALVAGVLWAGSSLAGKAERAARAAQGAARAARGSQ